MIWLLIEAGIIFPLAYILKGKSQEIKEQKEAQMEKLAAGSNIIVNGKLVPVPFKVNTSKIGILPVKMRPKDIKINGVVIHHTATSNPVSTFRVLKERGLSTHFEIDKEGTVWQYADPVTDWAFHAGDQNKYKIGIDLTGPSFRPIQYDILAQLIKTLAKEIGFEIKVYDWSQKGFQPTDPGVIAHAQASSGVKAGKIDPSEGNKPDVWNEIIKRLT
jgi:hypothetical protein